MARGMREACDISVLSSYMIEFPFSGMKVCTRDADSLWIFKLVFFVKMIA